MTSAEVLSTDISPTEEELFHGLAHDISTPADNVLNVGGDIRYLSLRSQPKDGGPLSGPLHNENFWMQRDLELSMQVTNDILVDVSGGFYALGDNKYESQTRRHYALINLNEHLSFRAGRFYPAYGIMDEDHTIATRSGLGWDEGQESYNLEMAYKTQSGEFFLTPFIGPDNNADLTSTKGYVFRSDEKGVATRLTAYAGERSQVGISGLYAQLLTPGGGFKTYYGAFGIIGLTKSLYLMNEVDAVKSNTQVVPAIYSFNQLGYEVSKGFHIQGQYQRRSKQNEYDARVQWFPRPHFELVSEFEYADGPNASETLLFLMHYYL